MQTQPVPQKMPRHDVVMDVGAVISHQFKTPLAAIKSSLEVVRAGALGPVPLGQQEYLTMALDNVERLITLVRDLLDASRIDQNQLTLDAQPTDLTAVVHAVVAELAPFARAANAAITVTVTGDIPTLTVDGPKVQQVVSNIVYNAIRYSPGKGTVKVSLQRRGRVVVFSCLDNGIGIPPEDTRKVFTKFYRSRRAVDLAPTGSGLGLYIARAIVVRSGGKIWFRSEPGKGTTFSFSLPAR